MKEYLYKLYYLLGIDRSKIPILVFLFLLMSMLDLLGLGLIGPYVALAFDPEKNLDLIISKFDIIGTYFNKNNVFYILVYC